MKNKRLALLLAGILTVGCLATGCGKSGGDEAASSEGTTISVSGSTSVGPSMEKIAERFEKANEGVSVEIQQIGSSAGIKNAIDGVSEIGMASRDLKDEEKSAGLQETKIALSEFERLLGIQIGSKTDIGQIISRTDGKRIAQIKIGGKTLTGKEVREKLNLKSSDFTWYRTGNQIVITTKGYGHGVGMSQYGANGMAQEGKTYKEIIAHYYKDVTINEATAYLPTITAKK